MTQIDLGPLNEDCIALRDGLACKCEEDGQPVLALTLRQIASRYQRLLNKLFIEQANDDAEKRVAELAETLENIICALGLSPVSDGLTEPLIIGVIAAMRQRMTELEAALAAERAAHAWRPFHVNGDHPIGVPIEAIIVVEDDPDNLTWVFDVRFWRPAAPQEPTPATYDEDEDSGHDHDW